MKLVKNLIRKYYKFVSWAQPVLTGYTTSTNLGNINVHATSDFGGNCRAWKIMIGSVSSTVDKDYWQLANSNAKQSLTLTFPYKLKISDIKITTRPKDNYTRNVGVFDSKGEQIGSTVNCKAALKEYILLSDASIITDELIITVFAGSGSNTYFGLQNLQITAQRVAEGTSSDYDFYEDGFEYKAVKGEEEIKLVPNVTVAGSPTINNGVVSGFSTSNYLELADDLRSSNNGEYIVKFTTGTNVSTTQRVLHCEYFLCFQFESGRFMGYNWQRGDRSYLIDCLANTTYWFKLIANGTSRTYAYSLDGSNWTTILTETDTSMNPSSSYRLTLGTSSKDHSGPFLGSIDLNECYININGSRQWTGMREEVKYTYKGVK